MEKSFFLDCNNCSHLSMTETEQNANKRRNSHHRCSLYNCRVTHIIGIKNHHPRLIPCKQCVGDSNKNFTNRDDKSVKIRDLKKYLDVLKSSAEGYNDEYKAACIDTCDAILIKFCDRRL